MTRFALDPKIRVTHLSDAADVLGVADVAAGGLMWLGPSGSTIVGPAYTIHQRAVTPGREGLPLRHPEVVAKLASAGDIVVIAYEGETRASTWGEAHAMRAKNRGLAGVLIDGTTRDLDGLREHQFPVLCRGGSPMRSTNRLETLDIACTVTIMGVRIRQGDPVAIDGDGFVCVPVEQWDAVSAKAHEIALKEQERDQRLAAGGL